MDVKLGFCVLVSLILLPKQKEHMHSSSHIGIFFLMDDLKLGKTLTLSFPTMDHPSSLEMLPKKVPFSLKELSNLVKLLSFYNDSPQVKSMEETLRVCEESPIKGETKYCATSIEAMRDFVQHVIGENTQIEPLITSTDSLNHNQLLIKMVACHTMTSVYYCHHTISKSKVFKVSLRNGDKVEAIVACHLDTSDWSPSHVSFRVLGLLPGTSHVCHFYPSYSVVWVPKTIATTPSEASE
ncbi:hypothetical protein R3W88_011134 [Solanum pinnatisectum]|uniref:BURP domain-containing protein n=1 Tax=Solanum pinnatisectum TaxID=50273 RepID=A0AAV9L5N9_9SOLN|nr:hypothetical protein R3W88_011134 [Solanum pinnatisectum]